MIDLIEGLVGLVMFVVTAIIEYPVILLLIIAGFVAALLGGVGSWVIYIAASLVGMGLIKRNMGPTIENGLAGWGLLQMLPMGGLVVHAQIHGQRTLGLIVVMAWIAALVIVGWKVPNRHQAAGEASPPEASDD